MQRQRLAILSSGPSLRLYSESDSFDLRIGVNRAATVHACDWWSVGDAQAFWRHINDPDNENHGRLIGRPRVLTMSPTWAEVMNNNRGLYDSFPEWMTWEKLRDLMLPPQEWDTYSAGTALVLAGHLAQPGAEIVSYGVDMTGGADFAGFEHGGRYNDIRWERERKIWARVAEWLRETRDVSVIRIGQEAIAHAA